MFPMPYMLHIAPAKSRFVQRARALSVKGVRSPLIALLVALCLLIPMSAVGLVLCIGVNGHIAFEPARHSRCATPIVLTSSLSQQITPQTSLPDHCGPCVDVPLWTSDADTPQSVLTVPLVLQLEGPGCALVPRVVSAALALPCTPCLLFQPRVTDTTLSTLRTVILLV